MPKAASNIIAVSPHHNIAAGDLVDQLGTIKAQITDLETREKALRDELIHRGATSIDGAAFSASVTEAVRWTLDAKAVKTEMGEACGTPAAGDRW
jgi:hypothetical protein